MLRRVKYWSTASNCCYSFIQSLFCRLPQRSDACVLRRPGNLNDLIHCLSLKALTALREVENTVQQGCTIDCAEADIRQRRQHLDAFNRTASSLHDSRSHVILKMLLAWQKVAQRNKQTTRWGA